MNLKNGVKGAVLVVALLLLATTVPSFADSITFSGDGTLGDFTGTIDITASVLTITLTNTSAPANGGFITAFAVDYPSGVTGAAAGSPFAANFSLIGGGAPGTIATEPPGGDVGDFGASTSGTWQGGGSPTGGIGVGETGTFTFNLTGTNSSAASFLSDFEVRFRGFDDGGSDKVTGGTPGSPGGTPGTPVPEPGTLTLLGCGLIGLAGFVRRNVRK